LDIGIKFIAGKEKRFFFSIYKPVPVDDNGRILRKEGETFDEKT